MTSVACLDLLFTRNSVQMVSSTFFIQHLHVPVAPHQVSPGITPPVFLSSRVLDQIPTLLIFRQKTSFLKLTIPSSIITEERLPSAPTDFSTFLLETVAMRMILAPGM